MHNRSIFTTLAPVYMHLALHAATHHPVQMLDACMILEATATHTSVEGTDLAEVDGIVRDALSCMLHLIGNGLTMAPLKFLQCHLSKFDAVRRIQSHSSAIGS